jgi:hypothetical protein
MLLAATESSVYRPPLHLGNFTWEEEEKGFCEPTSQRAGRNGLSNFGCGLQVFSSF